MFLQDPCLDNRESISNHIPESNTNQNAVIQHKPNSHLVVQITLLIALENVKQNGSASPEVGDKRGSNDKVRQWSENDRIREVEVDHEDHAGEHNRQGEVVHDASEHRKSEQLAEDVSSPWGYVDEDYPNVLLELLDWLK